MRRLMQASGAEVIHLGHNRSVDEVVAAAVQEDAQSVAVTSYQGGHMEYFRYMRERLDEEGPATSGSSGAEVASSSRARSRSSMAPESIGSSRQRTVATSACRG